MKTNSARFLLSLLLLAIWCGKPVLQDGGFPYPTLLPPPDNQVLFDGGYPYPVCPDGNPCAINLRQTAQTK
jgi:hypothetical protein